MKVFISWSGIRSKHIAEAIHDWVPDIILECVPWISSDDIEPGKKWNHEISQNLSETKFGIIVLTPENCFAPWIHFEAGALAKSIEDSNVVPLLYDMKPTDLPPSPLTQFQAKIVCKKDIGEILKTIANKADPALDSARLASRLEKWWPDLDAKLKATPKVEHAAKQGRSNDEKVDEILAICRSLSQQKDYRRNLGSYLPISKSMLEQLLGSQEGSSHPVSYSDMPVPAGLISGVEPYMSEEGGS